MGEANGGNLTLTAGNAATGPGTGGNVTITAGNAASSTTAQVGGDITITAGNSAQASFGGQIYMIAGAGVGSGVNSEGGDILAEVGKAGGGGGDPGTFVVQRTGSSGITTGNTDLFEVIGTTDTLTDGQAHASSYMARFWNPTLNGVAGGGTESCARCATVWIQDAPSGSNITFTEGPYALLVAAGEVRFNGGQFIVNNELAGGLQLIAAGDTIAANSCGTIKLIHSNGAVTTNTTDTFTAPASINAGCIMHVCNIDSADNITLDNNARFRSPAAADVVMTPNDCITVGSAGNQGVWFALTALVAN